MAFDGIVTKKVIDELQNLINYKIDKIYQPDKNTLILGLYGNFTNIALLSCISSNNYRIHLTTHILKNPTVAPNFCMLLRKHILGYKIKNIYTQSLERVVYIELENSENPDKPIIKTLVVELMGKHSNIILLDNNKIIIDSIRHTSVEEKAQRDIYPTARYFPPIITKYNLLDITDFQTFYNLCLSNYDEKNFTSLNTDDIINLIVEKFNGISVSTINSIIQDILKENTTSSLSLKLFLEKIYNYLFDIINSSNLSISYVQNAIRNDYTLALNKNTSDKFSLNFALDDFYYSKESNELFKNYRNSILNLILSTLKKYEKRLQNIDNKLSECDDKDNFKLYGELITANLYKIPSYNVSSITLENYYDNNNLIEIPLDKKYSPQYNAKHYFKKYNKLKNALEIVGVQKQETLEEINYIESIVYELENCQTLEDVQEVYNEISDNYIFADKFSIKKNTKHYSKKPKKMTSNKFVSFNPLKYTIDSYTIYVGRNNKENDYLTNKFANKNDIWFHTKDIHGSHVILKTMPNEIVPENIIYEAAKLAASHSKAKNSSSVPVDYCSVRFVKKVPGNKPGLVTYRNNKTIYV